MHSVRPDESEEALSPPYQRIDYGGRVRTGCLVCRARKVKCDEQRPSCQRCTRSKKICTYKTPGSRRPQLASATSNLEQTDHQESQKSNRPIHRGILSYIEYEQFLTPETPSDHDASDTGQIPDVTQPSQGPLTPDDAEASPHSHQAVDSISQGDILNNTNSLDARHHRTSVHIFQTLTEDWLVPSEISIRFSFSSFLTQVDSPLFSPFDGLNWQRVKAYVSELGVRETSIATSVLGVQALYRAQVDRLPMAYAMSIHQAATISFKSILVDDSFDFEIVLVVAFLLCLSTVILPNEDGPPLSVLDTVFESRLEAWLLNESPSPVSLRLCAWLLLLHTCVKRVGGSGLLPEKVSKLLHNHIKEVPVLSALDSDTHPENGLFDTVSAPIFAFYFDLQKISRQVAEVSHYHRSRITQEDQAEVTDILASLRHKLSRLWDSRPSVLRLQPHQLGEHFSPAIAGPLTDLAGICVASYFTEVVIIRRTHGDPPFPSPEAIEAMKQIRKVVEADRSLSSDRAINAGYLRPLYYYAIESLREDHVRWAIDCLRQINNPLSRNGFLASLAELLGEAQRDKGRRVTMKAFCYQTFGVPLPFM